MPDLAFKWHLGSELWAERCAMERANFICQRCHKEPATEVHHLAHVGVASDLLPICSACHRSSHRKESGQWQRATSAVPDCGRRFDND